MSGNIMNGQKQASRNERYLYAHFSSGGLAFSGFSRSPEGWVGLHGQPNDLTSPDDLLLNPDPQGPKDVAEGHSPEHMRPGHSLMYPWGYSRVWAGKVGKEFDSVYASLMVFPSNYDKLIYQGEALFQVGYDKSVIKAVGLYQEQKNPEDTRPVEEREMKTMIFMALVDAHLLWDGFQNCYAQLANTLEGWSIDPATKERKKLWSRSYQDVGKWYGMASVSPDGLKLASVATVQYPEYGVATVELSVKTGEILSYDYHAITQKSNQTTTDSQNSDGEYHLKSVAVWVDCPGVPQGWGTALEAEDKVTNYHRTVTTTKEQIAPYGSWYPWACQYDDDEEQTLLVAHVRQLSSSNYSQQNDNHMERHDAYVHSPCVGLGDNYSGSEVHHNEYHWENYWKAEVRMPDGVVIPLHHNTYKQDSVSDISTSYTAGYAPGGGGGYWNGTISETLTGPTETRTINTQVLALDLKAKFMAYYVLDQKIITTFSGSGGGTGDEDYTSSWTHTYSHELRGRVSRYVDGEIIEGQETIINRPPETYNRTNNAMLVSGFPSNYFLNMGSLPLLNGGAGIVGNFEETATTSYSPEPSVVSTETYENNSTGTNGFTDFYLYAVYRMYYYQAWSPWTLGLNVHAVSYNGVVLTSCPKFTGEEALVFSYPEWAGKSIPTYQGGSTDLEYNVRCYTTREVGGMDSSAYLEAVNNALAIPIEQIPYVYRVRPVQA